MIDELDKSLETLLKRELPSSLTDQVTVSFETPDDQFPPSSVSPPAIDFFLYDVRENNELRSNQWVEKQEDRTFREMRPLVRLDCSYLVTAWAGEGSTTPAQDEHRLLSEVISALLRHPTIPVDVLHGSLKEQAPPLPTVVLQPGRLQSLGEFWQALGGKPKAAFDYTVTIAMQPFAAIKSKRGRPQELVLKVKKVEKKEKVERRER